MTNKCDLVAHHRRRRDWQQKGQLERRHGISEWGNWNGSRKRYTTQLSSAGGTRQQQKTLYYYIILMLAPSLQGSNLVASTMTAYVWFIKRIYSTTAVILQLLSVQECSVSRHSCCLYTRLVHSVLTGNKSRMFHTRIPDLDLTHTGQCHSVYFGA